MTISTYFNVYKQHCNTEACRGRWVAAAILITAVALTVLVCGGIACLLKVNLALPVVLPVVLSLVVTVPLWVQAKRLPSVLPKLLQAMIAELKSQDLIDNMKKPWNITTEKEELKVFLNTLGSRLFLPNDSLLRKQSLIHAFKKTIECKSGNHFSPEDAKKVNSTLDKLAQYVMDPDLGSE